MGGNAGALQRHAGQDVAARVQQFRRAQPQPRILRRELDRDQATLAGLVGLTCLAIRGIALRLVDELLPADSLPEYALDGAAQRGCGIEGERKIRAAGLADSYLAEIRRSGQDDAHRRIHNRPVGNVGDVNLSVQARRQRDRKAGSRVAAVDDFGICGAGRNLLNLSRPGSGIISEEDIAFGVCRYGRKRAIGPGNIPDG